MAITSLACACRNYAYTVEPGKADDSTRTASAAADTGKTAFELKRMAAAIKILEARMDKIDTLTGAAKKQSVEGFPAPDGILDSAALSDFTPTYVGFEHGTKYDKGFPALSFTIFQGVSAPLVNYRDNESFGYSLNVSAAYHGGYDFDKENHSGPVLSRFQNPQLYLPMRFLWGEKKRQSIPLYLGWAHESNGQFIETPEDAHHFDSINTSKRYYAQDFASMGWNYWWLRSGYELRRPFPACKKIGAIGLTFELQYRVEQTSLLKRTALEDTSLFDSSRTSGGIKGYDGTRLSLWMTYRFCKQWDVVVLGHFQTAELDNDLFFEYPSYGLMIYPTLTLSDWRIPFFLGASSEYKHELSQYTRQMKQVNVGILLSTSSFIQENFKNKKKAGK